MEKIKRKLSQRIISIISALGLICLGLSFFAGNNKPLTSNLTEVNAEAQSATSYLSAPQIIESNEATGMLFIYDSYTKRLSSLNSNDNMIKKTSSWTAEIISLCHTDTHLLALTKETGVNAVYIIDEETLARTKLTYSAQKQISCLTACGNDVYMYLSSDDLIRSATIDKANGTLTVNNNFIASSTDFGGDEITGLMLSGSTLYYTTTVSGTDKIYKLTDDGIGHYERVEIAVPAETGSFRYITPHKQSKNYILTSTNHLLTLSGDSVQSTRLSTANANSKYTSITFIGTTKYIADICAQSIWKLENGSSSFSVVFKNETPTPAITNAKEHKHLEVIKSTALYATPFATESLKDLEAGDRLTVIARDDSSYMDYYYCIYTNKSENIYGYIKKDDSFITLEKTEVYISLKIIGDSNNIVYTLPSGIKDESNQQVADLASRSTTTQIMAQKATNSAGDDFYLIELENGKYGYIRYSQVTTNFASSQVERIKCNGKTKRETIMYICPSSTAESTYTESEIEDFSSTITIKANTRIFLNEKVKAGNNYTKVTYQTETGETYIGYIKTADLDADGLTPLQLAGVILVAVNILILLVIFIARKKVIDSRENSIPTAK